MAPASAPLIDRLPLTYRQALALRGAGLSDAEIADQLGLDPVSVPALVQIGREKLASLRRNRAFDLEGHDGT